MEYLYHYTTIESLALILKNKTIRFKSLDTVDDKREGLSSDIRKMGQFVFVSCWTNKVKESIPIWNMYGGNLCGVRIALPKFPFYHYPGYSHTLQGSPESPFDYSTIFRNIHFDQGYILPQGRHYLKKVKYTDDPNLLIPNVIEQVDEHHRTNWIDKIGTYKTKDWSFQSEVRYKLNVLPRKFTGKKIDFENIPIMEKKHLDISLRHDALSLMKIVLGPKATESHSVIVESLRDRYNPKATIKRSSLLSTFNSF